MDQRAQPNTLTGSSEIASCRVRTWNRCVGRHVTLYAAAEIRVIGLRWPDIWSGVRLAVIKLVALVPSVVHVQSYEWTDIVDRL